MKNYNTPYIELTVFDTADIITTSGNRIKKSGLIPDVEDVADGASFM